MIDKIKTIIYKVYKQKHSVFIIFVLGTFIFWFLNKLSKDYNQVVTYSIEYVDLPNQYIFQEEPHNQLSFRLETDGFYFFSNAFRNNKIEVSLKNIHKKSKYIYFLNNSQLKKQVRKNLNDKIHLIEVLEDSLVVKLGKKSFKKVPVVSDLSIKYHSGYNSFTGITLEPNVIEISGPAIQVAKINKLKLSSLIKEDVMESIKENITVVHPNIPKIELGVKEVLLKVDVEKITEKSLMVPLKITNASFNNVVVYPKKIKITCQVRLSEFNEIKEDDFLVVCDYNKRKGKYMKTELITEPLTVSGVKLHVDKVEFLILK